MNRSRIVKTALAALWVAAGCVLIAWLTDTGHAQRGWGRGYGSGYGGYGGGRRGYSPPEHRDIFPGETFTFCRAIYTERDGRRYGRGGPWTDYPDSEQNFSKRLSELTTIKVNTNPKGEIEYAVVDLAEPAIFNYPFIYMLEVADLEFSDEEVENLRSYLLRGGFLMVDDFWGDRALANWEYQIGRVLPPDEFPMTPIPLDHPIFHIVFDLDEVPQVPSVGFYGDWLRTGNSYEFRSGGPTDDPAAHCFGIMDTRGKERRLMVVVMHNSDLGDGWEEESRNEGYFRDFSVTRAFPMGVNIVVYAMTH